MTSLVHLVPAAAGTDLTDEDVLTASSRSVRWRFELLDRRGRTSTLDGVVACSIEQNIYATVRGGGSLTYLGPAVDWLRHRIRVHAVVEAQGRSVEWPLGTFYAKAPATTITGSETDPVELELYDAMYHLSVRTTTANPYHFAAGSGAQRLRDFFTRYGVPAVVENSDNTLRNAMSWAPGTPYLRVVNDALEALGYFSCFADGMGVIRCNPYQAPATRGVERVFAEGPDSILAPEVRRDHDDFSVPNQVVLVGEQGEEGTRPLSVTVTDTTSPYSYESTGVRIGHVEENVAAANVQVLEQIAWRRLNEVQRVQTTYEIASLLVPLQPNAVVRLHRKDIDVRAVVEKIGMTMGEPLMTMTVREVTA